MSTATKARNKTGTSIDRRAREEMRAASACIGRQDYETLGRVTEIVCAQGVMRFQRGGPVLAVVGRLVEIPGQWCDLLFPGEWPGLPELVATTDKPCNVCAVDCEFCLGTRDEIKAWAANRYSEDKRPSVPTGVRTCNITGCGGRGYVNVACEECSGSGALQVRSFFHRLRALFSSECPKCKGSGQQPGPDCECCAGTGEMTCDVCKGTKRMPGGYMRRWDSGFLEPTTGRTTQPREDNCGNKVVEVTQCPSCRGYKRELEITPQALAPYIYAHLEDGEKTYPVLGPVEKIVVRGISPREVRSIKVIDIAPDRDGRLMSLVLEGPHAGAKAWLVGGTYTISTPPRRNVT